MSYRNGQNNCIIITIFLRERATVLCYYIQPDRPNNYIIMLNANATMLPYVFVYTGDTQLPTADVPYDDLLRATRELPPPPSVYEIHSHNFAWPVINITGRMQLYTGWAGMLCKRTHGQPRVTTINMVNSARHTSSASNRNPWWSLHIAHVALRIMRSILKCTYNN